MSRKSAHDAVNEMPQPPFFRAMASEWARIDAQGHGPYNSAHEAFAAFAVLLEEVDEFWEEVRTPRDARSSEQMRHELIQIATLAWRAFERLGFEDRR